MFIYCIVYENDEKITKILTPTQFLTMRELKKVVEVSYITLCGYQLSIYNVSNFNEDFVVQLIEQKYNRGVTV